MIGRWSKWAYRTTIKWRKREGTQLRESQHLNNRRKKRTRRYLTKIRTQLMLAWTRENMLWSQKYGKKDTVRGENRKKYPKRRGGRDWKK